MGHVPHHTGIQAPHHAGIYAPHHTGIQASHHAGVMLFIIVPAPDTTHSRNARATIIVIVHAALIIALCSILGFRGA